MPRICLNMIVRNEADKIERCLRSLSPWISTFRILDTGSTDGTQDKIIDFFADKLPRGDTGEKRFISGGVRDGSFENFEQARNDGLAYAREHKEDWDYLLLCDADMELVVDDKNFAAQLAGGLSYDVTQRQGSLAYLNRRFVHNSAIGKYIGVTHEYLDVAAAGLISGIWFDDHADGSNRKDKFRRDIRLLKKALRDDPNNGRYWYYLGQSYRDLGRPVEAADAYQRRVNLGGWVEETWSAMFNHAHCLHARGDEKGFIAGLIDAYNFRPSRAEPLYDLAKHYRVNGKNYAALLAAEEGLRIPPTKDSLFVQEYVYNTGMAEEFAICAYYDETRRSRGAALCNKLALDPKGTWASRDQARANLFFYVEPLASLVPSFVTRRIGFTPPDGYTPLNPSIVRYGDDIQCVVRSVNYTMDEQGRYLIKGTNGEANSTNPIKTRNFLLNLSPTFEVTGDAEILPPEDFPSPAYNLVVGFEDMRLFTQGRELWSISNVREQNSEGWCEQVVARIGRDDRTFAPRLKDYQFIRPQVCAHEKNWMPWLGERWFMYSLDKHVDYTGAIGISDIPFAAESLRGGTQVIPFNGGYLAIVHEARENNGKRYYTHRFVFWDAYHALRTISKPFFFHNKVIEFAAGLAWHPDGKRLMISYGLEDKEAWIATVDWHDIAELLHA